MSCAERKSLPYAINQAKSTARIIRTVLFIL